MADELHGGLFGGQPQHLHTPAATPTPAPTPRRAPEAAPAPARGPLRRGELVRVLERVQVQVQAGAGCERLHVAGRGWVDGSTACGHVLLAQVRGGGDGAAREYYRALATVNVRAGAARHSAIRVRLSSPRSPSTALDRPIFTGELCSQHVSA